MKTLFVASKKVSLLALLLLCGLHHAMAEVFFTEQELIDKLYSNAELVEYPVEVNRALLKEIKGKTSARLITNGLKVWEVREQGQLSGWLFNAEVLGKHENIRYALAIDSDGVITDLEIMEYRETHGGQIKDELWRAQMYGRRLGSGFKLGKDIDNITGATLSCRHLSDGVHGLMIVHERLLKK